MAPNAADTAQMRLPWIQRSRPVNITAVGHITRLREHIKKRKAQRTTYEAFYLLHPPPPSTISRQSKTFIEKFQLDGGAGNIRYEHKRPPDLPKAIRKQGRTARRHAPENVRLKLSHSLRRRSCVPRAATLALLGEKDSPQRSMDQSERSRALSTQTRE